MAALVFLSAHTALAGVMFSQGFETDTSGWVSGSPYGLLTRAASGDNGITASSGGYYGYATGSASGPFTRFGGYQSVWAPFTTSLDIYLDTSWASGFGFDYSSAASRSNGAHLRDFIFHVTSDTSTGQLLVGGSNNSGGAARQDLENINHYTVTQSGWYTFQHNFYDNGGSLAVDLNLFLGDTLLWTETRFNIADLIPSVAGGNRYGWFTFIGSGYSLAIDNSELAVATPEPGTMLLMGVGALGAAFMRRRRSA